MTSTLSIHGANGAGSQGVGFGLLGSFANSGRIRGNHRGKPDIRRRSAQARIEDAERSYKGNAAKVGRDLAPRLSSVDVGGKPGAPIETKDVTNAELARRIAFILGQAAREQAEETPLAASGAGNGLSTGVN